MPLKISGFWANLQWSDWLYGLLYGAIGGGSNSVNAAFGAILVDPKDFSFGSAKSFKLMGWTFAFSALMSMFLYLKQKPLPDKIVEKTLTSQTTTDARGAMVTVEKMVEKTTQVVPAEEKKP